jgi:hypothetical protein
MKCPFETLTSSAFADSIYVVLAEDAKARWD